MALDWDAKRLGLEDDITLIPSVSMPVFRSIVSQLKVLTLLSREDPFPLVVLEAGLLGVPTGQGPSRTWPREDVVFAFSILTCLLLPKPCIGSA